MDCLQGAEECCENVPAAHPEAGRFKPTRTGVSHRERRSEMVKLDEPKKGESLSDYLKRHKAHPSQPDRAEATQQEMDEADVTEKRLVEGIIITIK
jgi:hypothetical protein